MVGGRKAIETVLIGFEIETNVGNECTECTYSPCEDCNVCDACHAMGMRDEVRKYLIQRLGKSFEQLLEDYGDLCELCREFDGWEVVCDNCDAPINPCEYCPYGGYGHDIIFPNDLNKYIERTYVDESCGVEINTVPLNITEAWVVLPRIVEYVQREYGDCLRPEYECGGHTNISFEGWEDSVNTAFVNTTYFADILTYLFLTADTYYRDSDWRMLKDSVQGAEWEKYSYLHVKGYALEFRWLDTPVYPINHLLATYTLVALCLSPRITLKIHPKDNDDNEEFERIENYYYNHLNGRFKKDTYLKRKFSQLLTVVSPTLRKISDLLNVDLIAMLKKRFAEPCHEYGEIEPIYLHRKNHYSYVQRSLSDFTPIILV